MFFSGWRDVGRTPQIIDRMTDFWRFHSIMNTGHVIQKLQVHILQVLLRLTKPRRNAPEYRQNDGFLETCLYVNNLLVDNSLQYFNNNLRISSVAKDNMKFFRICFWVWICISNMCLNNNSWNPEFKKSDLNLLGLRQNVFFLLHSNLSSTFRRKLFSQKSSIIDIWLTSEDVSAFTILHIYIVVFVGFSWKCK